jgi:hypothetical protein
MVEIEFSVDEESVEKLLANYKKFGNQLFNAVETARQDNAFSAGGMEANWVSVDSKYH